MIRFLQIGAKENVTEVRMKITLIENAFDFVLSALEYAQKDDTRSLKYAILHLSDGVELILKERLKREHWSLLFADTGKANKDAFNDGDFKSVDSDDCIERLDNIVQIEMPYQHIRLLKKLRSVRNKLQHFEYNGTKDEVVSILVVTWNVILDFLHDNLPDTLEDRAEVIKHIKQLMLVNEGFVVTRLASIQAKIDEFKSKSQAILECPRCLRETLLIPCSDDQPNCLYCRYTASPEDAVQAWGWESSRPHAPKDWHFENSIHTCPQCGSDTLVCKEFEGYYPPDPGWVCFGCGNTWDYSDLNFCDTCNNPCEGDGSMCQDCVRKQMEDD